MASRITLPARVRPRTRAFTLTEVIVVMVLVAVLLGLTIPVLGNIRAQARRTLNLSNLAQHAGVNAAYLSESRGVFPNFVDPVVGRAMVRASGTDVEVLYFQQDRLWPLGMGDRYYNSDLASRAFVVPWLPPDAHPITSYLSPCVFRVDPSHYDERTFQQPPAQARAIRADEVQYPSAKALFSASLRGGVALGGGVGDSRWGSAVSAALVDGHAGEFAPETFASDWGGDGDVQAFGSHVSPTIPFQHTASGVRGRDTGR
jgi:prepilin-type N-terminal cleavage/methylation domain-containing protein